MATTASVEARVAVAPRSVSALAIHRNVGTTIMRADARPHATVPKEWVVLSRSFAKKVDKSKDKDSKDAIRNDEIDTKEYEDKMAGHIDHLKVWTPRESLCPFCWVSCLFCEILQSLP